MAFLSQLPWIECRFSLTNIGHPQVVVHTFYACIDPIQTVAVFQATKNDSNFDLEFNMHRSSNLHSLTVHNPHQNHL